MSCAACAWCGAETPRAEMAHTEHGLTCARCVRTADAERMRQADALPRVPGAPGEPQRIDELARHLLLQTEVEVSPMHEDYPRALAAGAGQLETSLRSVDLAALIDAQEDAYDRRQQTEYAIRELVWLVRWQARELAHAGRELASTREQLVDANNAQLRIVKGGEA